MLVENFTLLCTMYKTINGQIKSIEFGLMFELIDDIRDRVTRANASGNLVVSKFRTGFGSKCILYVGMNCRPLSSCPSL